MVLTPHDKIFYQWDIENLENVVISAASQAPVRWLSIASVQLSCSFEVSVRVSMQKAHEVFDVTGNLTDPAPLTAVKASAGKSGHEACLISALRILWGILMACFCDLGHRWRRENT